MIADEVMAGFGRTGKWFAVDHWDVVPDLITMAKGLTSSYLPLGAVGMRRKYAEHFTDKVFYGGLTYNSHPLACAAALATIAVYEDEGLIERAARMGELMRTHHEQLAARHPSVGAARNIGLFGDHRARPRSVDHGADGAVQRHLRRDGGARKRFREPTACTRCVRWNTSSPTRRW